MRSTHALRQRERLVPRQRRLDGLPTLRLDHAEVPERDRQLVLEARHPRQRDCIQKRFGRVRELALAAGDLRNLDPCITFTIRVAGVDDERERERELTPCVIEAVRFLHVLRGLEVALGEGERTFCRGTSHGRGPYRRHDAERSTRGLLRVRIRSDVPVRG